MNDDSVGWPPPLYPDEFQLPLVACSLVMRAEAGGWNVNPAAWTFVPTGFGFTGAVGIDFGADPTTAWFFPAPVPTTPPTVGTSGPAADAAAVADASANLRDIFGLPPEPPSEPTPEAEPVRRIKFREFL